MQENNERRNPFLLAPVVTLAVLVVFGILSFIPFEKSLVAYIVGIGSALIVFGGLIFAAFRLRGRKGRIADMSFRCRHHDGAERNDPILFDRGCL